MLTMNFFPRNDDNEHIDFKNCVVLRLRSMGDFPTGEMKNLLSHSLLFQLANDEYSWTSENIYMGNVTFCTKQIYGRINVLIFNLISIQPYSPLPTFNRFQIITFAKVLKKVICLWNDSTVGDKQFHGQMRLFFIKSSSDVIDVDYIACT